MTFREVFARELARQLYRHVLGYAVLWLIAAVLEALLRRAERNDLRRVFSPTPDVELRYGSGRRPKPYEPGEVVGDGG